jgi:CDP-glycerol glycerophosphotransferase (TagB/SpsB family)
MDDFLQRIRRETEGKKAAGQRRIAFFSWAPHVPLPGNRRFDLLEMARIVMRELAVLALEDPSITLVMKIKDQHMKDGPTDQRRLFREILAELSQNGSWPRNIRIEEGRMAAQEVIFESDIVVTMQTTVVLEAAIAGKPIILPHFQELMERPFSDLALMYADHHDVFDVPRDLSEFKNIIQERLRNGSVRPEVMARRRALFARFVSPLDGTSTQRCREILTEQAHQGRQSRMARLATLEKP